MLQFRIRSLFVLIFAAAIFLGVAQTAGYGVTVGIATAILLFRWAIWSRGRGRFVYVRVGTASFALVAIWFLAVDWSWFWEHCPDCDCHKDIAQYRVLGIPVCSQVYDEPTATQRILSDLGVPCEHANLQRCHDRFWGATFLASHRIPCLILVDDYPHDYTEDMATKLRHWGAGCPQRAIQLHDLVIRQHKYLAFWKAIDDLTGDIADADTE